MQDFSIYQVLSHILRNMGYEKMAESVMIENHKDIKSYINFIRSKFISNKEIVEFIDYFL